MKVKFRRNRGSPSLGRFSQKHKISPWAMVERASNPLLTVVALILTALLVFATEQLAVSTDQLAVSTEQLVELEQERAKIDLRILGTTANVSQYAKDGRLNFTLQIANTGYRSATLDWIRVEPIGIALTIKGNETTYSKYGLRPETYAYPMGEASPIPPGEKRQVSLTYTNDNVPNALLQSEPIDPYVVAGSPAAIIFILFSMNVIAHTIFGNEIMTSVYLPNLPGTAMPWTIGRCYADWNGTSRDVLPDYYPITCS